MAASEVLVEAARAIREGLVVAAASESSIGLLVDALSPAALEALFVLKGRRASEPVPVLVRDDDDVSLLVAEVPPEARSLMQAHWPGPLTIVMSARPEVPARICGGTGKIGLRVPGACPAADVLRLCGRPVTATSANLRGQPPLTRWEDVRALFGDGVAVVVPAVAPGGPPSTVVDVTVRPFRILRQGAVRLAAGA
jgi:L-threonylcarbamoyladenylate synthase